MARMKWLLALGGVVMLPAILLAVGKARTVRATAVRDARVERGAYLVKIMGCNDCHTPWRMGENGPEPDMTRMLSGHPETLKLTPPQQPEGTWISSSAVTNTAFAGPWASVTRPTSRRISTPDSASGPKTCS